VTNVRLTLEGGTSLYGELTIGDFILSECIRLRGGKPLPRLTSDI
jgi:hypothetical protein